MNKGSYGLFYKKIIDIDGKEIYNFLVCKSYKGIQIDGMDIRIYCRTSRDKNAPFRNPDDIKKEIKEKKAIIQKKIPGVDNLRSKKLGNGSIIFIEDRPDKNFYNYLGGKKDDIDVTERDTLYRELEEELLLNVTTEKKIFLDNIQRNISYEYNSDNKNIYLINYDTLHVAVKCIIESRLKNPNLLHKLDNYCGVNKVEHGEILLLNWVSLEKLKKICGNFNRKNEMLNYTTGNLKGGNYYEKYLKYKSKYLELNKK